MIIAHKAFHSLGEDSSVAKAIPKKYLPGEGYFEIQMDVFNSKSSPTIHYCIMCKQLGNIIAPETEEVLCRRCMQSNDEARGRK